ncbi:OmpA family protein [Pseudoalteromonas sp. SSM20]|uniref:OmpA family protein n=1 Tax=Pseudoalteromonas sp. SSM20 TaxID=3139394 RepID=UPI003BA8733D
MIFKGKIAKLIPVIALATSATTVNAQQSEKDVGFYISGFADYYFAHWHPEETTQQRMGESLGLGVDFGYRFNESFAARLELAKLDLAIEATRQDKSGHRVGIDALYHLGTSGFYLVGGIKQIDVYDSFSAANVGFGGYLEVADNWTVNTEALLLKSLESNDYIDSAVKLGVSYTFANNNAPSKQLEAAPAPLDSDQDGVADGQDDCLNTPSNEVVDSKGCTVIEEHEIIERLVILFNNDQFEVAPNYFADIEAFAKYLKSGDVKAKISGHTSTLGDSDYNQKLSLKRAEAVKAILVNNHGVNAANISVTGEGENELFSLENTEEAHKLNRRAVVTVTLLEQVKKTK